MKNGRCNHRYDAPLLTSSPKRRSSYIRTWIVLLCAVNTAIAPVIARDAHRSWSSDLTFIRTASEPPPAHTHAGDRKEIHEISPLGFVSLSLITVYQQVISLQDKSVCNFSPSCSHFAVEAIQKTGTIRGILLAIDRIQRCNPYARFHYTVDSTNFRALDPVSDYTGDSR